MKLTILLLTAALTHAFATGKAQNVTISGKDIPLKQVFRAIEKQTGYVVLSNKDLIASRKAVSLNARDLPLKDLLNEVLKDIPFKYDIQGKTIFISRRSPATLHDRPAATFQPMVNDAPSQPVSGRITDSSGNPIQGASIRLTPGQLGTSSNADGSFLISHVSPGNYLMEISSVGFETARIRVLVEENEPVAVGIIVLSIITSPLDEVVLKGYYATSKRLNTGSVVTVKAEDIERHVVTSPMLALQGQVPGLYIQQSSGLPGSVVNVNIRGINSITSGKQPLYIIDGVPFNGERVENQMRGSYGIGGSPNAGSDPMNMLNSKDIERIEVLKDADATAIYGSRGANGVIIITTRKGKAGKTSLNLNAFTGTGRVSRMMQVLDTKEYLDIRRKAFANDNITPDADNAPDLLVWDQQAHTDYQEMLIGGHSRLTEINASLSGGTHQTSFLLSTTLHNETTVMPGDSRYRRSTINMKVNHLSADRKFKADLSSNMGFDNNRIYGTDFTETSITYPGNYPLYHADGSLYWGGNFTNPLATLNQSFKTRTDNLLMNGTFSYSILPDLQLKLSTGYNKIAKDQKLLYPSSTSNPAYQNPGIGFYTNNSTTRYIVEPQADYMLNLGKSKLNATLGGTWQSTLFDQPLYVIASNFASDALLDNYGSAGTIFLNKNTSANYKSISVFGRANYNWDGKYVLNGVLRRDGSSRFGPDRKFGVFGSAGAAWIFTGENFMQPIRWLNYGKLRGSYGTVGNDQISNYGYLDAYYSTFPYGNEAAYIPAQLANPNYSWEVSRKLEAALELGFLGNRLLVTGAWFRNRSGNQLAQYPLSPQSGFESYTANLDAIVQNKGVELEVKATPAAGKKITWEVSGNITSYRNRLLSFPGLLQSTYVNELVVGQPLNIVRGYHFTGTRNGLATVEDKDHDGNLSSGLYNNGQGDYIIAGTTDPRFYGGLTNSIRYKQWQLDIYVHFVSQKNFAITGFPGLAENQPLSVLHSAFTPSTQSSSDSYNSYANFYLNSDAMLVDASFARLKNLSLSYTLPDKWKQSLKMASCLLYVRAQNLFTITGYKGFDPEVPVEPGTYSMHTPQLPTLKMLTAGLQCSF